MIRRIFKRNETFLFLIIILFCIVLSFASKSFFTIENWFDLIRNGSEIVILSIGVFVVLLSGGIDLSFTAIAIIGQYVATRVLVSTGIDNLLLAFLISCILGILLGSINGLLISYFKIPTIITTLGTLSIFHGALLMFAGSKAYYADYIPECYTRFGQMSIFVITKADGTKTGLSIFVLILTGIILITWFILKFTMLGKGIYAIGGNKDSAERSGFNVMKIQLFVYCYMGFLSGIIGIMNASRMRMVLPASIVGIELMVIAAVVLGGARISGGYGTILGTILGVVIILILNNNLVLIGLSSFWSEFIIGLVIIIGVTVTSIQAKREGKKIAIFK